MMESRVAAVARETPDLDGIDEPIGRLERQIRLIPWFAAAGEPLAEAERAEAARYLAALGLEGTEIAGVATWPEAKAVADDPAWDRRWWDAEERLRLALRTEGQRRFDADDLERTLSRITATSDLIHGAAAVACARAGIARPALIKSAAGAATQACYQAALAVAAGADANHAFLIKLRLFAGGRWPLGIVAGVYRVL